MTTHPVSTRTKGIRSAAGLLAEALSVTLPILVIWLSSSQYGTKVTSTPEWSVGAIILFCQACVKFTTSVSAVRASKGPMSLLILFLVMGLVVSCYLLVRTTELENTPSHCAHCGLQQVAWFFVAFLVYLTLGLFCDLKLEDQTPNYFPSLPASNQGSDF